MNDTPEQLRQQREQSRFLTGLHKEVSGNSPADISLERRLGQSSAYVDALDETTKRMSLLKLDRVYHADFEATRESLQLRSREQRVLTAEADKEASYKEKQWKQERAAKRRGEYKDYRTDEKESALRAAELYREAKEHPEQAPPLAKLTGNEFLQKPAGSEPPGSMGPQIAMLMRHRDDQADLVKRIEAAFKEKSPDQLNRIYLKYMKLELACMEDAINTWYLANGVTQECKDISPRAAEKAREHLPLALEKYQFVAQHIELLYGREMREHILKSDDAKDDIREMEESDRAHAKEMHLPVGVSRVNEEAVTRLERLIAEKAGTPECQAHKKEIIEAYREMVSEYQRINRMGHEATCVNNFVTGYMRNTQSQKKVDDGIQMVRAQDSMLTRVALYHAESAEAYIRFLLEGKKADPLHAAYIRERWQVEAGAPDVPLGEARGDLATLRQKAQTQIEALSQVPEGELPQMRSIRETALEKLEQADTVNRYHEALAYAASLPIMLKQTKLGMDEQGHEKPYAALLRDNGYRDICRSLTPVTQPDAEVSDEKALLHVKVLYSLTGHESPYQDLVIPDEEFAGSLQQMLTDVYAGVDQLRAFMTENPGVLEKKEPWDALEQPEGMDLFYKKAQGLRDSLSRITSSAKAVSGLTKEQCDLLAENYAVADAVTTACRNYVSLRGLMSGMSATDVLAADMEQRLTSASYAAFHDESLRTIKSRIERKRST